MVDRRAFLKGLAIVGATLPVLGLSTLVVDAAPVDPTLLPVWALLRTAWPAACKYTQEEFDGWFTFEMKQLAWQNRARFVSQIGPLVEWSTEAADGTITTHTTETQAMRVWIAWSKGDEAANHTKAARINFVAALIENTLNTMDFVLIEHAAGRRIVVAKDWYCDLGETITLENNTGWAIPVWTCAAFIPQE